MIEGEEVKIPDTSGKGRSHTCVKCDNCSTLFYKPTRFLKKSDSNFCSRECKTEDNTKKNTVQVVCSHCGTLCTKKNSSLKNSKSGLYFCSRSCKDNGQSIEFGIKEIWPAHYTDGSGINYREKLLSKTEIHECAECGYKEHPEILQAHHKDRDRTNNTLDNLELLCPNCHQWEHYQNKDGGYSWRK